MAKWKRKVPTESGLLHIWEGRLTFNLLLTTYRFARELLAHGNRLRTGLRSMPPWAVQTTANISTGVTHLVKNTKVCCPTGYKDLVGSRVGVGLTRSATDPMLPS